MMSFDASLDFDSIDFPPAPSCTASAGASRACSRSGRTRARSCPTGGSTRAELAHVVGGGDLRDVPAVLGRGRLRRHRHGPQVPPDGLDPRPPLRQPPGRRKYAPDGRTVLPPEPDPAKAEAAAIFREAWLRAKADPEYGRLMRRHRALYETPTGPHPSGRRGRTWTRRADPPTTES